MGDRNEMTIGFVGLGNMGAPMCQRLLGHGYDLLAFDLNSDRVDHAVADGARAAASAAECAAVADLFLTSLPRPDHVDAVMRGDGALQALRPGSIWVDLTTNRKDFVAELAATAPEGVAVVDSPVTGAVDGARTGRLTLFVGGDQEGAVKRASSVLECLGTVIACGGLGSGNVVKLVTNQLWFAAAAAIGEGFALGMKHGVDLATLHHAIRESVGDSFVAPHDAPSIFAGHYDPSFTLDLCLKDLGLISELQQELDVALPITEAAHGAFAAAADRYGPAVGGLHVAKALEDDLGISFRLDGEWTAPWEVDE